MVLLAGWEPKAMTLRSSTCTGICVQVGTPDGRVWRNANDVSRRGTGQRRKISTSEHHGLARSVDRVDVVAAGQNRPEQEHAAECAEHPLHASSPSIGRVHPRPRTDYGADVVEGSAVR